ncbi:methylated-DNA--[protein]-cysteine S-methyltransferase [Persicobacter sp. CCB-QB2]|uniref:methylated-DNA--[protein]-cysteine S-methyltransferase n=1 Tax=Persicobacter sp. CCB-QB2 TaxID=1561025 RepID=UPI0006A96220|nr:methylated-DNA--[protein]-cysteine S-methyltransferase [Persicobacter sp. CCB-QB2]
MQKKSFGYYPSPLGVIKITVADNAVIGLTFVAEKKKNNPHPLIHKTVQQLVDYFKGKRKSFDLALRPEGTDFQKLVWQALENVPFGKQISYKALAIQLGDEKLVRAVANANAKNPIAILIPCHRVVGSSGALTGYAWGLDRKEFLLKLERGLQQMRMDF